MKFIVDVLHLRYFIEVVKQKSFTRAASNLHLTQPTISKMVKDLEDDLGVILLDRRGRDIRLTDAGQLVMEQALQIVESFTNLSIQLEGMMDLQTGSVRIGIPPMVGSSFFSNVITEFHHSYPNITIQMEEVGSKEVLREIDNGILDFGVVLLPIDMETFDVFQFWKEDILLLIPANHPFASKQSVQMVDLAKESLILFREDFSLHDQVLTACNMNGFVPDVVCKSSQWDFISRMVQANLGIAFLPRTICNQVHLDNVQTIPVTDFHIDWNLALIWKKGTYMSFASRELLSMARKLSNENIE